MSADPWIEGIEVPGHADSPSLTLKVSVGYGVSLVRGDEVRPDDFPDYYSALDLLEAALCVAYATDPERTAEVLTRNRLERYASPRIGPQSGDDERTVPGGAQATGLAAALNVCMDVLEELERVVDDPTVKDADWRSAVRAAFLLAATP